MADQLDRKNTSTHVILLDPSALTAFGQLAWTVYCAALLQSAGTRGTLQVSSASLASECRDVLAAGVLQSFFPNVEIISATLDAPNPASDFAFLSGSAVLTGKLVANIGRVFVHPAASPAGIDTAIFLHEVAEGVISKPLQKIVDNGSVAEGATELQELRRRLVPAAREVTLVTSIFNGDRFLAGFLENMSRLRGYARHEHFLVRAASSGNEHEALLRHVDAHPTAVYLNLANDPGLYEVWNQTACLASGRYLSSANLDDRRHPDHLHSLAAVLDAHPDVDVASAALRVTHTPNVPWETSGNCKVWYASEQHPKGKYGWQELFRTTPEGKTASRNMPHCMPVWRRELHGRHGFFNEREFGPSADWEFWLRCGSRGARFWLHDKPLGLYLKTSDSYWNIAGSERDFDAHIIATYKPLADDTASDAACFDAEGNVADIDNAYRRGARFGVLHRLVQYLVNAREARDINRIKWLEEKAREQFGINAIGQIIATVARGRRIVPASVVFDCLVSALAESDTNELATGRLKGWRELVADYGSMTVSLDEVLLFEARVCWVQGRKDSAWRLMKKAYRQRCERFWPVLQALFRFELPLSELTERIIGRDLEVPARIEDGRSIRLWYYPDFRNNAYQSNLYAPLRNAGAIVEAIDRNASVDIEPANPSATNILHLHWIHTIFNRRAGQRPVDAAMEFLDEVRRAKERGVRVLWTVHNYLSHEGRYREVELALRHDLAALVDDVYLHHPMIRDELDWLPAGVVPKLIEHGSYHLAEDWREQRRRARAKLGVPESAKVVVCAGQWRSYKQLELYLPTLLEWVSHTSDGWLLVLGQVHSSDVEQILSAAGSERVVVIDRLLPEDEMDEYLCAADMGFLSYAAILTSGTLFHMLSRALPVIAPTKGTVPAYVVDGWNGYLYQNVAMAGAALDQLNSLDSEAIARMHENALSVARKLRWEFRLDTEATLARHREVELGKQLEQLREENSQLKRQLEQAKAEKRSHADDREALLEYSTELETRYRQVLASRTWKLMAPVRFIGRWLRALMTGRKPERSSFPKKPRLDGK